MPHVTLVGTEHLRRPRTDFATTRTWIPRRSSLLTSELKTRGLEGVGGLEGVEVATSDAHSGLRQAVEEHLPGVICTERFRVQAHFRRNVALPAQRIGPNPRQAQKRSRGVLDNILEASFPAMTRATLPRPRWVAEPMRRSRCWWGDGERPQPGWRCHRNIAAASGHRTSGHRT
jgi:hypothetical protein